MELQAKKSEFGEGWRKAVGTERQKEMLDLICSKGAPKVLDSLDYNLFIEPIEFYKDKDTGEINKFDY